MNIYRLIIIIVASIFAGLNIIVYFSLFLPFIRRKKMNVPTTNKMLPFLYREWGDLIFQEIDFLKKYGCERIEQRSFDKHKLAADLYTVPNAKGTVILCHGFQGYAYADNGVATAHFVKEGYNALIIYQRAHFESEGKNICFGIKERYDCLGWIKIINSRFGEELPVFLYGISMGAATVLMTTGFNLPQNVKCVIADCGFTSPYEIFKSVLKHIFPFLQIGWMMVFIFAGYNIKQYSTLKAMKKNKIPVIFFHGQKDAFVPSFMSRQNYDACIAPKELYLVPDARHTQSLYTHQNYYWDKIREFMKKSVDGTFEKEEYQNYEKIEIIIENKDSENKAV